MGYHIFCTPLSRTQKCQPHRGEKSSQEFAPQNSSFANFDVEYSSDVFGVGCHLLLLRLIEAQAKQDSTLRHLHSGHMVTKACTKSDSLLIQMLGGIFFLKKKVNKIALTQVAGYPNLVRF